jgi:glycerophosphoryl diester phosphodiesterase
VIHDHTLERTTNGKGLVGAMTMAELKQLDAGNGEQIPRLEEVLELARGNVGIAIEVKSLPVKYPGIEQVLVDKLRQEQMVADSAVISFDHRVVRETLEIEPELVGGVLVAGRPLLLPQLLEYAHAAVYSPHWSFVDSETVTEVHTAGAVVGVWTVDDVETLQRCLRLGVDAIYTNSPGEMKAALAEQVAAPG